MSVEYEYSQRVPGWNRSGTSASRSVRVSSVAPLPSRLLGGVRSMSTVMPPPSRA
jgi:hypothetical protein